MNILKTPAKRICNHLVNRMYHMYSQFFYEPDFILILNT